MESNGVGQANGKRSSDLHTAIKDPKKRARVDDHDSPMLKKSKNDDIVVIEDDVGTGAIEILD